MCRIPQSIEQSISNLFGQLEKRYGAILIGHAVG